VTRVKSCDKVVLSWIKGGGIEAGGSVYGWSDRKVHAGGVPTFQRHAIVSENRLTLVPANLPMDIATLLGCAAPTGMGAIFNVLDAKSGQSVAIFGTGGVGLNACMAAAFAGAAAVIGTIPVGPPRDGQTQRRKHVVIQWAPCKPRLATTRRCGGGNRHPDGDGTGHQRNARGVAPSCWQCQTRRAARPRRQSRQKPHGHLGGDSVPDRDERFGGLLASGRFPVRELLSKPYRLAEADKALRDLASGTTGRPLIDMKLT
jgi:S-(hydroxymethyl)glutathione dehydrogenase/alcohol dehydrogenase